MWSKEWLAGSGWGVAHDGTLPSARRTRQYPLPVADHPQARLQVFQAAIVYLTVVELGAL